MLLSETSLAYEIWNLHLSTEPVIHLYTLYHPVHAVCIWENQSVSVNHITKGTFDLEMTKSYIKLLTRSKSGEVTDYYWWILQTSSLTASICARGPVMTIVNHIVETTTDGNMFTGPSETSHFSSDRRPMPRIKEQPLALLWAYARAGLQSRATDSESYPNLVSSLENQLGELVALVIYNPAPVTSTGSDIAAPRVGWVLMQQHDTLHNKAGGQSYNRIGQFTFNDPIKSVLWMYDLYFKNKSTTKLS